MRFLSTRIHGVLDYLTGGLLIIAPWMLRFARGGAETWIMIILGATVVVYSLITDYEWGIAKRIPMRIHLLLDLASGVLLAASPWLFGFSEYIYLPHLVLGIFEIGASLVTQMVPSRNPIQANRF
jgi:hypothetical protein